MNTIPTVIELKAQAKRLRAETEGLSHGAALERVAHLHGARDWNTASAMAAKRPAFPTVGERVSGAYLGHRFKGRMIGLQQLTGGQYRVTVHFDAPIDVVAFDSFSSFRQRVSTVVSEDGTSPKRISDGTPHMQLDLWG